MMERGTNKPRARIDKNAHRHRPIDEGRDACSHAVEISRLPPTSLGHGSSDRRWNVAQDAVTWDGSTVPKSSRDSKKISKLSKTAVEGRHAGGIVAFAGNKCVPQVETVE